MRGFLGSYDGDPESSWYVSGSWRYRRSLEVIEDDVAVLLGFLDGGACAVQIHVFRIAFLHERRFLQERRCGAKSSRLLRNILCFFFSRWTSDEEARITG